MKEDIWRIFPFSTLRKNSHGEQFTDGAVYPLPVTCRSCPTRECVNLKSGIVGPRECRFGMTWQRLDADRVVVGLVETGKPLVSNKAKKRMRQYPELRVTAELIARIIARASSLGPVLVNDVDKARRAAAEQLKTDPETLRLVAEDLRKDFDQQLGQSHDFIQLVKLIKGYAETLLRSRYPDLAPEEAAEKLPTEGAIYFSTELMIMKMDALAYLKESNLAFGGRERFKIHPYLLKYRRIYDWRARQKELNLVLDGTCYAYCTYSPKAIGVVFQSLLDNLVKYAPAGSSARILFTETAEVVNISFSSLGPRIEADEHDQVFLPGYRARAAKAVVSEGLGVGLATARSVSDSLGLRLSVNQSDAEDSRYRKHFETTFKIQLAKSGSYPAGEWH